MLIQELIFRLIRRSY